MQNIYLILFITVIALSYFLNIYHGKIDTRNISIYILFVFFIVISFTLFCGIRFNVGIDYMTYYTLLAKGTYKGIINGMTGQKFEPGYILICDIISFLKLPAYSIFFVFAFITSLFFFLAIRKTSPHIVLSYFVYFSNGFFFTSLNMMRQSLVVMVGFYAFKYIRDKQIVQYLVCIFIAFFIHKSVLLLLPCYFLFRIKIPRTTIILLILCAVIMGQAADINLLSFLCSLAPPPYNAYADIVDSFRNKGAGTIPLVLAVITLFLTVTSYTTCISKQYRIYFNSFIVAVLLLNMFKGLVFITRIAEYFLVSFCILFPVFYLMAKKSPGKYAFFIVLFLLLFFKILHYIYFSDPGDLLKYQTIFNHD